MFPIITSFCLGKPKVVLVQQRLPPCGQPCTCHSTGQWAGPQRGRGPGLAEAIPAVPDAASVCLGHHLWTGPTKGTLHTHHSTWGNRFETHSFSTENLVCFLFLFFVNAKCPVKWLGYMDTGHQVTRPANSWVFSVMLGVLHCRSQLVSVHILLSYIQERAKLRGQGAPVSIS